MEAFMILLDKILKNCNKSILSELGFGYKKDRFYRLYGSSFQTIIFDQSSSVYDNFQIHYGIEFLSQKITSHHVRYSYYDLTGKKYDLDKSAYGMGVSFNYDRDSQENSNIIFEEIFNIIKENIIPILNQIIDESTYIEIGEKIAGESGKIFHMKSKDYYIYAITGKFKEALEIINADIIRSLDTTEENYKYFINNGDSEKAREILFNQVRHLIHIEKDFRAIESNDRVYFKNMTDINENNNRDFLWKEYKIKL